MNPARQVGAGVLAGAVVLSSAVAGSFEAHLYNRAEVRLGLAADDSYRHDGDNSTLADLGLNVRPLLSGKRGDLRWQAEADFVTAVGDSLERLFELGLPPVFESSVTDQDLFDLSHTFSEGKRHRSSVRVDRLAVTATPDWGTVTMGRSAVTWGGGLVFNPFDLFNPFAPSDVVRDFKTGSDLIHFEAPMTDGNLQLLAVARRDPVDGDPSLAASSFAVQYKRRLESLDLTAMLAWHHDQPVAGAGLGGTAGGAAWHIEGTWVKVQAKPSGEVRDYVAAVANLQYAWMWGGRNVYGVIEYYFNGLGTQEYGTALLDPVRAAQFARGNVFVLGRHYAAGTVQVEWHPLLNLHFSAIMNLEDPSMLLQPRALWDASQNLRVTFGIDLPVGSRGSEFGGYEILGVNGTTRSPVTAYVLATLEF